MTILGRPLSWFYGGATKLRNHLYDSGIMTASNFEVPIVSIGNITTGGTGKTPVVQSLLQTALSKGLKPGVVSRGYGGEYTEVQEVDLSHDRAAQLYGDEPVLTKTKFPNVPFYVCRERARAVSAMLKRQTVNLIFADDAFQHRALARDLDVVLLDATQEESHYRLLPEGHLRESLAQLSRADFVIITKSNFATYERKRFLKEIIEKYASTKLKSVIYCEYEITNWDDLSGLNRAVAFSAIGNPLTFEKMLSEKINIISYKSFKDHYQYTREDLDDLIKSGEDLITTEKDFTKLRELSLPTDKVHVAKLGLSFDDNMEKLIEAVHKLSS